MTVKIGRPSGVIIYGLQDPETQELRYIGKTSQSLQQRFSHHIWAARSTGRKAHTHRSAWLRSLLRRGLLPEIFEIETVPESEWESAERFWIAYFKYIGANLVNGTDGGDGVRGTVETRRKMGQAQKRKAITPE